MDSKKDAGKIKKAVPKRHFPRLRIGKKTIAAVVIIAVAIGVGIWILLPVRTSTPTQTQLTNSIFATSSQAKDGKYDAAIANLQTLAKQATTNDDKLSIYTRLAAFSSAKGDKQKTLEYYQTAEQYAAKDDPNIVLGIATAADAAGNKAIAIQYYQKLVTIYKSQLAAQPYLQPSIDKYQTRISELGGK